MSFCMIAFRILFSNSQLYFWIVEHISGAIIFQSVAAGLSWSPWEDEWLWGVQFIPSDELSRVQWKLIFIYIWWSTAVCWLGVMDAGSQFFTLSKWQKKQVGTPPRTGERSKPLGRGEGAKAHSAELHRVSRVGSMVQRSIHNSGQVELLFFNVTLTMSQAWKTMRPRGCFGLNFC